MEMYTESALLEYGIENLRDVYDTAGKREKGVILGLITEHRVAKNRNAEITDKAGSDIKQKKLRGVRSKKMWRVEIEPSS